jgi:hypothetical protein
MKDRNMWTAWMSIPPPPGGFGFIVAVSEETSVNAVNTTMMIIEITSWIKSIAFLIR